MTKREFLDTVFALAPNEANAIMDAFDEYVDSNEPPANNSEIPNSSDTISRAKAIEALDKRFDSIPMEQTSEILMLRKDLRKLPPAQPERIIHCKDCKHHWTHKCMDSMPIERCDLGQTFYDAEVDYCSLAKGIGVTT